VLSSPLSRAQETARTVADLQALAGYRQPPVSPIEGLNNRDWGSLEGRSAAEARLPLPPCCMQQWCSAWLCDGSAQAERQPGGHGGCVR
jgi:broad specificity phosphatase PhoE